MSRSLMSRFRSVHDSKHSPLTCRGYQKRARARSMLKKGDRHLAAVSFFENCAVSSEPVPVFPRAPWKPLLRRWLVVTACLAVQVGAVFAGPPVVESDPLTPEEQIEKFHLPPGFEIQLVASEPDIQKPMNLNFDSRGRLWVTHS